jgi:O-succinylhomoserine sulfhydrylase
MRLGGALLSFEIDGGQEKAKQFIDNLEMLSITANLGDTRTTITHPATTTHSKLSQEEREEAGITDGYIRMSIGLEHVDDIIKDIDQAISNV